MVSTNKETNSNNSCVIRIGKGLVRGRVVENVLGGNYYSFQGMRYAKPPLGRLRFKAPQREEPWEGVYDATVEGSTCVSRSPNENSEIVGSEDCLFINVYTNELPKDNQRSKAVMFWVHGGGINYGSGTSELFGPDFLLTEDVVLVTFNYRLGILAGASFEDPEVDCPGNAVLKDVVRALEWVQENIEYFNGDKNNVTIFGASSGGLLLHLLSHSPLTPGLYHKAICMSSTNFMDLDEQSYSQKTHKFAKLLGFQSGTDREMYEFLLVQPAEKLVEAGEELLKLNDNNYLRTFDPVLEAPAKSQPRALVEPIEKYIHEPHPNMTPMMFGSTSEDGMCMASEAYLDGVLPPNFAKVEECVPLDMLRKLKISRDSDKAKEIGLRIKNFYYGNETPSFRSLDKYVQLQTDLKYRITGKRMIGGLMKFQPNTPVYMYRFSFESPANLYKKIYNLTDLKGTCHCDELTYLFNTKYTKRFAKGSAEEKTLKRMVTFWTNFAKYTNPNPRKPTPEIQVKWEPSKYGVFNHMDIGRQLKMVGEQPDAKRMKFWDDLFEELGIAFN